MLGSVLPVFGIMAIGLLMRQRNWLTAEADQSLMRLVINLLIPALIFHSVLGNEALRESENLFWPPLVGYGMVVVGIGVAWMFARAAGLQSLPEHRTFAFLAGLQNYSYLTIPLCVSLFDSRTTGVLFVHNVGTETAMWTIGMATLTGSAFSGGWRKIFNAPLVALLLALVLNLSEMVFTPPASVLAVGKVIFTVTAWLGQSAIPLALILIGAIVADHLEDVHGGKATRVVSVAILVRLGIMPVLFLLLAELLPCSVELKRVLILQGAMPSAVLPIVLAKHGGGDARVALQVVLGTSLAGLITIPLWVRIGERLIGF